MYSISTILLNIGVFCISHIATLPISKLCYLTDVTSGPSRVITSGECGVKCGSKPGCLTFIICDIAYSKTCTIYKLVGKETCGQEGVHCSYFVQKTVPSDSDEITKSLQSGDQMLIGSPVAKTTTTITKTVTTVFTSYPVTSTHAENKEEMSSSVLGISKDDGEKTSPDYPTTTATSSVTTNRTTSSTILSDTLGLTSSSYPVSTGPGHSTTITNNEMQTGESTTAVSSTAKMADCPEHLPKALCQN